MGLHSFKLAVNRDLFLSSSSHQSIRVVVLQATIGRQIPEEEEDEDATLRLAFFDPPFVVNSCPGGCQVASKGLKCHFING